MQDKEPTNSEILQAVHQLGKQVEGLGSRTDSLEKTTDDILQAVNNYATHNDQQWAKNEERWAKNEERLTRVEATMVTKAYLDDKLADLKGDLVVLMRKEDAKLKALVDVLAKRKLISAEDVKAILSLQPFPQLYV